jgi:hypothetical protein
VTLNLGETKASFSWAFNVDHWTREIEAAPYNAGTAYTSASPILSTERLFWLDTTGTDIGGTITASLNAEVQPKTIQGSNGINGRAGFQLTNQAATMTFRELFDSTGELVAENRWLARTAKAVMLVLGSHGNCIALRIPVARKIELPNPQDDNGMQGTPEVLQAQDAGTYADPDGTILKVPDFSISIF